MVEREHRDPCCHQCYHEIFVERVRFAEDGQVEEHNGKELA